MNQMSKVILPSIAQTNEQYSVCDVLDNGDGQTLIKMIGETFFSEVVDDATCRMIKVRVNG